MRSIWALAVLAVWSSLAQAASPVLSGIMPRGGQRGTEVAISFNGARLADAKEIMCYSPGFTVTGLEAKDNVVTAKLKIPADCPLGEHAFRVRTASGITDLKTFWVGAMPVVEEKEPNNDFANPQAVPLGCTIHGTVTSEDLDYFVVEAKKGQRISVEVEALRVATDIGVGAMFDPFIAILDTKRFELGTSDDSPLLKQDGYLSLLAPADGKYVILVRESSNGGSAGSHYRLHVGSFPRPSAVIPMGGRPKEEVEFTFLGDPSGPIKRKVKLPESAEGQSSVFAEDKDGISPSGLKVRVVDIPNTLEVEPNDAPEKATRFEVPGAVNGVIQAANDVDLYRFVGKKGQVWDIRCFARQFGSPLDPVLWVANANNGTIASNDDSSGFDSYIRFTVPADGEYLVGIRDHLNKGGPTYAYRIELTAPAAVVNLSIPQFSLYQQERQSTPVPRGNRMATIINVGRADVGGDVTIDANGLPAKLAAKVEPAPAFMSQTPVVFEATADAPQAGSLAEFVAKPVDPKASFASKFSVRSELVFGSPNNSAFWSYTAPKIAVAVTDPVPFSVSIVEPKVPLVHTGSLNLKVVAERRDGFKGPITIYPVLNPPGVGSAGSATIADGQTETVLPLNANGGAPPRVWKYVVWGVATVGNGPVWVSSQLANIEVAPPMFTVKLERATCEQGQTATIKGQIQATTPFTGTAKLKLVGLPAKTSTPDIEIGPDAKEFAFAVATEKTAPAGMHKNLYCQIVITKNGEQIIHNLGSADLRIDAPLAEKSQEKAPAKK